MGTAELLREQNVRNREPYLNEACENANGRSPRVKREKEKEERGEEKKEREREGKLPRPRGKENGQIIISGPG